MLYHYMLSYVNIKALYIISFLIYMLLFLNNLYMIYIHDTQNTLTAACNNTTL